jgi:gliding motility-associated-like protein
MRNNSNSKFIAFLLFVFSTVNFVVKAQNDCATATNVTDLTGAVCATSTVGTTSTIGAASCEEGTIDTWFHFTAQGSVADITVTASAGGFRPEFVVFESDDNTCSGLFSYWAANCFDLTGNYTTISGTAINFVPGNEYWIVVSSHNETTSGTLDVCVNNPVNPVNDLCTNASALPLDGTCQTGTTENAIDNISGVDGCQDGAVADHPDVFYTFVADNPSITFDVTAGTMTGNVELTIWGGDCTTPFLHSYACGAMPLSQSIPAFTVGNTYWVAVSTNGNEGTFDLCATSFVPVATPGQDCPTAQQLCDNSNFTVGTINAGGGAITGPGSNEDLSSTCFGSNERQAQWYQFSVNTSGDLEFQIAPNTWSDDYDWAVFDITATGCVINGNVPIACNWSGCIGMTGLTSNVASYTGGTNSSFDYYYGNPAGPGDCLGAPGGPDNGNGASQWENQVNLVAGNSYVILIDNYSTTSNNGYAFTWTGTDAGIGVLADFSITGGGCTDYNVTVADIINSLNSDTYTWNWGDGSPVLAGPSTNSHDYTAAGPGTYTIEVTVTDPIGCSKSYFLPVSVGTTLAADAGLDQTICSGSSTDIGGSPAATGGNGVYTYSWTPADATVSNPAIANPTINTLVNATYTLTVTDGLGCTATDDMNIIIDPLPTATAGGSETICSNGTSTVSGATSSNGSILWTHDGTGSLSNATTLTPTYTAAAGDEGNTVTLTMTVTSTNSCAPQTATATFSVIVEALPTATAGGSETICSNGTSTVSGATSSNGTILWTHDGAGSLSNATTLTPTYTAAAGDEGNTVTLTMTVTSTNSCAPATATATFSVIVEALPTATAGGSETICSNGTSTVSGATSSNGSILWTHNGAGSLSNATTLTPTYTAAAGDEGNTVTLTMTVTSTNSCAPATATATFSVIVEGMPTASAGGSQTICSNGTATVSGAASSNGSILWTHDGAGSLSNATTLTPTYTPAVADEGNTVTLTMTVTSTNSCAPQTATATYSVMVDASPAFGLAFMSPTTCNGSDGTITLSGLNNSDNYNVTYDDDAMTVGPTLMVSDGSGNIVIGGLNAGTYENFIVELISTGCSTTDPTSLSLLNPGAPDVDDLADQTACTSYTLPAITGTGLTGGESYWSGPGGTGTPYAAGATISVTTPIMYIYDDNGGACSDQETFSITIVSPPTASAGGTETICSNGTSTVSGASASNGTILWTHDGTGSLSNATTLTPTYTAAAGDEGNTVTLTMTVTSNNVCGGTATATFTVVVDAYPTATTGGGSQTICSNSAATVSGASATNGTVSWSHDGGGVLTNSTTLTPTYTAVAGDAGNTVTLTMTVTSTNACSPQVAINTYLIYVEALPTATAGGTETICSNSTATVSGASATDGSILWTHDGGGSLTNATTLTPTYTAVAGDAGTTVTLTMTVTSTNACNPATATATYTVVVDPLPTATAGGTQAICSNGSGIVSGASSSNGSILWTHNGFGSLTNQTTLTPTYTAGAGDEGNTVTLTMTVTSTNSCAPQTASATYTMTVEPLPTANAGGTQTVCSSGSATVSGTSASNGSILWTHDGTGTLSNPTTLTPTYNPTAADVGNTVTLTMTVTSTNACTPQTATATYTVFVDPLPTASAGGTTSICANDMATVTGASSSNGSISWTHNGSGAITAGGTTLTPTYTSTTPDAGNTVTLTMTVTSTNTCAPQTATATFDILVNDSPTFSLSFTSPTTCNGTEGTITFTGLTPSTNYNVSFDDNGSTTGVTLMTSDASGMITVFGLDSGSYDNFFLEHTITGCSTTDASVLNLTNPGAPVINDIADQSVCDSYTLPNITGTGLTGSQSYWTGPSATGTQLAEGTLVINSQTIYIYDINGSCPDEESFTVVVNTTPTITNNTNSSICSGESFDLAITSDVAGTTFDWTSMPLGTNVSGNSISGTGNISEVLTNNGPTSENVMYTITPTGVAPTYCIGAFVNYIITVNPNSDATFQSASYCEETTNLVLISGDTGGTFSFEPVPTDGASIDPNSGSIFNGIGGTDYIIKYVVGTTCPDSSTLLISTYAMPNEPYVSGQGTFCHNEETAPLNANGGNGTFTWYSDAALQNEIATGTTLTPSTTLGENVYYVTETENTCTGPATTALILLESCTIDIPTAFTPDNNGVDDVWELENIDAYFPNNQVRVYNRWGALLYESDKGNYDARPWDGTFKDEPLPVASYYFIVEFNDNETNPETGTVSIIKK